MTIRKGSGTMTSALQLQPEIITLEQYEALPESRRAEVFEGVIYDMASPSQIHQALSMELSNILYNYIKNKKGFCQVFSAPFDVKLSDKPLTKLTVSANTGSWIRSAVWSRSTISRENLSMWHTALMPLSR